MVNLDHRRELRSLFIQSIQQIQQAAERGYTDATVIGERYAIELCGGHRVRAWAVSSLIS